MILNATQLEAIRQRNDEELRRGAHATPGYPAHTVRDLLQTLEALKKEKKKWQRLAQERGQALDTVREVLDAVRPADGRNGNGHGGPGTRDRDAEPDARQPLVGPDGGDAPLRE